MKKISVLFLVLLALTTKAQFYTLHNFTDSAHGTYPAPVIVSGNTLYGMTEEGGSNNVGCIFSIKTNGSGYKILLNFDTVNGANPFGELLLSGNKLYGMTQVGGNLGPGCIFSIDTNGNNYKDIHDFGYDPFTDTTDGANPFGGLTLSGPWLYGMTQLGGIHDSGCIFKVDTSGSLYFDLFDFNGTNGWWPQGDITLSGSNLYGMAQYGGNYGWGCIFTISTSGTGFTKLLDFDSVHGGQPYGSLSLSGNVLFGATSSSGPSGLGNIFSIKTNGSGYKDLFDTGSIGSLTLSGNTIYSYFDNIFSIDTNGSNYKKLFHFPLGDIGPQSGSLAYSNGVIYGTSLEGLDTYGNIFSLDSDGCLNNFVQPICIATTDTSINKNVIIWGRSSSPPTGSFNIYDSTASGWTLIGNVPDTALSEYIDTASTPNTQSYSYRLSTVDSCGESALSPTSSSIYLQVIIGTGKDSLYWTPYVGFSTPEYYIYRGPALNSLTLIDSVSGGTLYYLDTLPLPGSIYLVKAVNPSGSCTPTHKHIDPHSGSLVTNASFSNGGVPHKPTGIADLTSIENSLVISPNPANGLFNVSYTLSKNENVEVMVVDEFGRKVYDNNLVNQHAGISKQQINLEGAAEGVYSLMMVTGEGIMVKKLVLLKSK